MLASAIFFLAILAVVAATMLSAGVAMTRADIHRLAQSYLSAGEEQAVQSITKTLSTAMSGGALPSPMPTIAPGAPACADQRCTYLVAESVVFTSTMPALGSTCDVQQTNCAVNDQANAFVNEDRFTARVTVTVTDTGKNVLAARSDDVLFRTLQTPPYLAVVGHRDGTLDDISAANAAGDDGGLPPATPNPCDSPAASTDDTTIRVAYQNAQSGACSDGSSWEAGSYSQTGSAPQGWSP
jgi:hypothetical protein